MNENNRAFTLLEQSIALTILTLILVSGVLYSDRILESERKQETLDRIEKIHKGIRAYYIQESVDDTTTPGNPINDKFPCPASPTIAAGESNYGTEQVSGSECAATNGVVTNNGYYYGSVPVRTLELPDTLMYDGWGRRFSFVVNKSNLPDIGDDMSSIHIFDNLYHIISHGSNGHGAYTRWGSQIDFDTSTFGDEFFNTIDSDDFTLIEEKIFTSNFDDIISSKTNSQFISELSGELVNPFICQQLGVSSPTEVNCRSLKTRLQMACIDNNIATIVEPRDISGLTCWIDFADASTISPNTDGAAIATVEDKSGSNDGLDCSATKSGSATIDYEHGVSESGENGALFKGANMILTFDNFTGNIIDGSKGDKGYTIVFAFEGFNGGNDILFNNGPNDNSYDRFNATTGPNQIAIKASSGGFGPSTLSTTELNIAIIARDTVDQDIKAYSRVNREDVDSGGTDATNGFTGFTTNPSSGGALGNSTSSGAVGLGGYYYEFIYYDRILTAGEVKALEEYLYDKWDN